MQIQPEGQFERTPVLENCAFFVRVHCGYCGYLIVGGSATELLDEEGHHAIECKATHGFIGTGNLRAHQQKHRGSSGGSRSEVASDTREGRTRALKELADSPHMEPSENHLFVQEKK